MLQRFFHRPNTKLPRAAASLLAPLSLVYGAATSLRNICYDRGLVKTESVKLPVICVGNVTAGGSGKSPFVDYLAANLLARGIHPVVLSRGYRGELKGPHLVALEDPPHCVGDEALMHQVVLEQKVPVVVAKNRVAGARFIEDKELGDVILLDDGFQHRYLNRDLNLLLLDVSTPAAINKWQDGKLLPAGFLRESLNQALARAHGIILVRRMFGQEQTLIPCLPTSRNLPQFTLSLSAGYFIDVFSKEKVKLDHFQGSSIAAASAIADPDSFFAMLRSLKIKIDKAIGFPDHHLFSLGDWQRIRENSAVPVITTAKDMVKLRDFVSAPGELYALMLEPKLASTEQESDFWQLAKLKAEI
jgi:tetraacyldisaccharide 4'-kinase